MFKLQQLLRVSIQWNTSLESELVITTGFQEWYWHIRVCQMVDVTEMGSHCYPGLSQNWDNSPSLWTSANRARIILLASAEQIGTRKYWVSMQMISLIWSELVITSWVLTLMELKINIPRYKVCVNEQKWADLQFANEIKNFITINPHFLLPQ